VPTLHRVTTLELPELQPYRTLRRPVEHFERGIFVAEGSKVVLRLLASQLDVVSLLVTEEWYTEVAHLHPERIPPYVFLADREQLESIVGFRMHQGIMAVARVPAEPTVGALIAKRPTLLAAVDGLVFAENVGVVVRNCAAFGVDALLVGETSASPYLRRAVRNSMGTVFNLTVLHTPRLSETLTRLHDALQLDIVIADAHAAASLYQYDCRRNLCVIFGNEDQGVSEEVEAAATQRIRIPMKEGVDSINVASSSAAVLAEIARQRTG
jgi:tRNA G18 (ribose-2'-O)-methylase SpoU